MTTTPDPRCTHPFVDARHRDNSVCWLLGMHPATATTLAGLRWFLRKRKARACLRRLAAGRHIYLVGTIRHGRGRPEHVYCGWWPQPAHLSHEVQLTDVFLRLDAGEIRRGPFVSDQTIRPDAQLWIQGQLHYLELDRGPDDARPVEQRLSGYEGCPHASLWLCATEERAEGLRRQAEKLGGAARFATLADALKNPHGEIWYDSSGQRASLRREADSPETNAGQDCLFC